jgi:hypothetical protein
MVSVKDETESKFPGIQKPISLLSWVKRRNSVDVGLGNVIIIDDNKSVTRAIWNDHLGAVKNFFSGGTSEEQENRALNIIMKSGSYAGLAFIVNELSWDVLDDELDEKDNTDIAGRLSALRNRNEHAVDAVLRGLALDPGTFTGSQAVQSADVDQSIHDRVTFLGAPGRVTLANALIDRRIPLLSSIALFALRGLPTHSREFIVLLDDLISWLPAQAPDLGALRWDAFYDNLICVQLEQARYRLLIANLPDMLDPTLPLAQRRALFDTLNRRDAEFRAMQSFINVMGTVQEHTDVERFMDARQLFMDNFTPNPPTPIPPPIAAFFNSVASEIVGLRADVANATQGMINAFTLGNFTETEKDDKSREVNGVLGERRAVLPFQFKALLIRLMEEGNMDDDDEQAVLQILTDSKARSIAEFAQLINAQGWESLSFSFDHQEYDDLELLLSKW